jgi:hypothetical protein
MNAAAQTTVAPVIFTSCPRTVVARMNGRIVKLGTFANYFLAEPVAHAAANVPGMTGVEMLISLPSN